jgi:hypothetical protein
MDFNELLWTLMRLIRNRLWCEFQNANIGRNEK